MSNFYLSMILGIIIVWAVFFIYQNYRNKNGGNRTNQNYEKARAIFHKNDEDLLGRRFSVPRGDKDAVKVNLYEYETEGDAKAPMVFVAHGGNLMDGDADQIDSFCNRLKDRLEAMIISINYTKLDAQKIPYQQTEIIDTVQYFASHSDYYQTDPHKIALLGFSGGSYLQMGAAALLKAYGMNVKGMVEFYPLVDDTCIKLADSHSLSVPMTLVTCNNPKLNQRVDLFAKHLSDAGNACDVKEYPDAVQGFIEYANPEYEENPAVKQRVEKLLDDDQRLMARACENWLAGVLDGYFETEDNQIAQS